MKEIRKTEVVCLNCHSLRESIRENSRRFRYWYENQRPLMLDNLLGEDNGQRKVPKRKST
jgi:hypothetical protein